MINGGMMQDEPVDNQTTENQSSVDNSNQADNQTTDSNKEQLLKELYAERNKIKSLKNELESLKSTVEGYKTTDADFKALQTKYDRLETFLAGVGGEVSQMLDSRSLTHALFESDKAVDELIKEWHQKHPTETSKALMTDNKGEKDTKFDMSAALRQAINAKR